MKSETTARFWDAYENLPEQAKTRARNAYRLFDRDPRHPSLHLKKVHTRASVYSVRISQGYRALGVQEQDTIIWFWIGSHDEYERLLQNLQLPPPPLPFRRWRRLYG